MPNRRSAERKSARIKVRFWAPGKPEDVSVGYTTNVSTSGCFIQTERPVRTSSRLQLEFTTDNLGFVCEGVVARSMKAPYELRQVKPSGMGVRFYTVSELLSKLAPNLLDDQVSASKALENDTAAPLEPEAPAPHVENPPPHDTTSLEADSSASRRAARNHPAATPRSKPPAASQSHPEPVSAFRIAPVSNHHLEKIYAGELVHGRLFIPTTKTYPQGSKVRIEIVLPVAGRTVALFATVTETRPNQDQTNGPVPAGLNLTFQLPSSSVEEIGTFLEQSSTS